MKKYRKKPVEIEAIQYTRESRWDCLVFCNKHRTIAMVTDGGGLCIDTGSGTATIYYGDWIIKGVQGEFYPCKDEIFRLTYEEV